MAVGADRKGLAYRELKEEKYIHSEYLFPLMDQCFEEAGISSSQVDLVAVGSGPGSYTGLRIGTSAAKGIAYALDIPMVAFPTLKAMAWSVLQEEERNGGVKEAGGHVLAFLPAGGKEFYCAVYDPRLKAEWDIGVRELNSNDVQEFLDRGKLVLAGPEIDKVRALFGSASGVEFREVQPSALPMVPLADSAYDRKAFTDPAYFEPAYLKPFFPTKQKKGTRS